MTRKELETLGLEKEQIDTILDKHNKEKSAIETERDNLKADITAKDKTIKDREKDIAELKKVDPTEIQGKLDKLQTQYNVDKKTWEAEKANIEIQGKANEYLSSKKFVNQFTKDSIKSKIVESLKSDESKGKSLDDIFNSFVKDEKGEDIPNILASDQPTFKGVQPADGKKQEPQEKDGFMNSFLKAAGVKEGEK